MILLTLQIDHVYVGYVPFVVVTIPTLFPLLYHMLSDILTGVAILVTLMEGELLVFSGRPLVVMGFVFLGIWCSVFAFLSFSLLAIVFFVIIERCFKKRSINVLLI
jgi:hypothetical protein